MVDILGIWAGDGGEGAKYWLHVFTELKNRGLDDVLPAYARSSAPADTSPTRPPPSSASTWR
jgi:hypothetical protein